MTYNTPRLYTGYLTVFVSFYINLVNSCTTHRSIILCASRVINKLKINFRVYPKVFL